MKSVASLFVGVFALSFAAPAAALDGVFNTGVSDQEESRSTLDVSFRACDDDASRFCGYVHRVNEPDGPSGRTSLPDGSPLLGYPMIRGLKKEADGKYRDGKINAIDESMNKGKMVWYGVKIDDLGQKLKVTGCLGFICPRTMYWNEVAE